MKYIYIVAVSIFSILSACAQKGYEKEVGLIFNAFKAKDYKQLKPLLDNNVVIGNLPVGMNDVVLPQVLGQMPMPVSYEITKTEAESGGTRVSTIYNYGEISREHSFLFNSAGKCIELDILKGTRASVMQMDARPRNSELPDKLLLPFTLNAGLIFTTATINGQQGNFVLDSGCPSLVVNSRRIESEDMGGRLNVRGVNGNIADVKKLHVQNFDWGGIRLQGFDAMAMDLSHLEEESGQTILGLIGFEIFRDYVVVYDYKDNILTLVKDIHNIPDTSGLMATIPFRLAGHIPIVTLSIGKSNYDVAIDCGATANLLSAKILKQVKGNIANIGQDTLIGADKRVQKVTKAEVRTAYIDNVPYKDMNTIFADSTLDQLNAGYHVKLEGLIGYEFLKQYKTVFNFKKQEMYLYKL